MAVSDTSRELLRKHNIFWTDVVDFSFRAEFLRIDLDNLVKGDTRGFIQGFFQRQPNGRISTNIPSHVRDVRNLLLDFKTLDSTDYKSNPDAAEKDKLSYFKSTFFERYITPDTQLLGKRESPPGANCITIGSKEDFVWSSGLMWPRHPSRCWNSQVESLKFPKHDMIFYFPVYPQSMTLSNFVTVGEDRKTLFENFSEDTINELEDEGLIAYCGRNVKAANMSVPSYSWFIALLKAADGTEAEHYNKAAMYATGALKKYENAARYAVSDEDRQIPPVVVMTECNWEVRIWLAYSVEDQSFAFTDGRGTQMLCIWKGSMFNTVSRFELRSILARLNGWAMNTLRPKLSRYITLWKSKKDGLVPPATEATPAKTPQSQQLTSEVSGGDTKPPVQVKKIFVRLPPKAATPQETMESIEWLLQIKFRDWFEKESDHLLQQLKKKEEKRPDKRSSTRPRSTIASTSILSKPASSATFYDAPSPSVSNTTTASLFRFSAAFTDGLPPQRASPKALAGRSILDPVRRIVNKTDRFSDGKRENNSTAGKDKEKSPSPAPFANLVPKHEGESFTPPQSPGQSLFGNLSNPFPPEQSSGAAQQTRLTQARSNLFGSEGNASLGSSKPISSLPDSGSNIFGYLIRSTPSEKSSATSQETKPPKVPLASFSFGSGQPTGNPKPVDPSVDPQKNIFGDFSSWKPFASQIALVNTSTGQTGNPSEDDRLENDQAPKKPRRLQDQENNATLDASPGNNSHVSVAEVNSLEQDLSALDVKKHDSPRE